MRLLFAVILVLNILKLFGNAVRLIMEEGFRPNSYFYHNGDGGHAYHYNLETANSIYFKCVQYEKMKCGGRAVLRRGGQFRHTKAHNHLPDVDFVAERHFRANVLNIAANGRYVSFQDILDEARRDRRYSRRVRSRMNLRRLRTPMYRARMASFPPIPQTLLELTQVLLEHPRISVSVDGEDNMYAGSVTANDGSHHILFVSTRMREYMQNCKILQGDGTFRARPATPHSSQCFVIVTTIRNGVIPLAWALMENRTYEAYSALFRLLKHLCPNLDPDVIISDWELAQQQAWSDAFQRATVQGCLWHLGRAFVKKANKLRILRYREAFPETLAFIRKACLISLLPENFFNQALEVLKTRARQIDHVAAYLVRDFFTFVETKWLGNQYRRQYMTFWRCTHRTNNACESHNRMLRKAVGAYRPNVYAFIEALSRLEHNAYLDMLHLRQGGEARCTRRWQSVYSDARLSALATELEDEIYHDLEESIWNFLDRGSPLIQGAFDEHVQREVGGNRN